MDHYKTIPGIYRRHRISIFLCFSVILLFIVNLVLHANKLESDDEILIKTEEPDFSITDELRILRLAFMKWQTCMIELLDDHRLSLDDMDPEDSEFTYLQWLVKKKEKEHSDADNEESDEFSKLWYQLGSYTNRCRSETDMWHLEPDIVPGTFLKFFLPSPSDTSTTFVRVGIGANVSIEQYFKTKVSPESEFFGADPVFVKNSQIYKPIGVFFPFAVGNETGLKKATLKYSSERMSSKVVNHIGIDVFFKNLIRRNIIDYLFFEGDGGEYDMMSHLAKNGTLERDGITVCQINIEYHLPKDVMDPRKNTFRNHIIQFIRDRKYTLLSVTNLGNLRVFWLNTSSLECARRYLERLFSNDFGGM